MFIRKLCVDMSFEVLCKKSMDFHYLMLDHVLDSTFVLYLIINT